MPEEKAEVKDAPVVQDKQGSGSAPELKTAPVTTDSKVEATPKEPPVADGRPPKGVETEFFKLRSDRRELKSAVADKDAEINSLKARLEALEKSSPKQRTSEKSGVDADKLFENPAEVLSENRKQAVEEVRAMLRQEQEQHELIANAASAKDWLLTRSHLKQDPNMVAEIRQALETRYARVADVDPSAAAEAAYVYVCTQKGIQPDLSTKSSVPAHYASSGMKSSSAGGGVEAPVITSENVKNFSREEVKKAVAEGRYKGKTIKI